MIAVILVLFGPNKEFKELFRIPYEAAESDAISSLGHLGCHRDTKKGEENLKSKDWHIRYISGLFNFIRYIYIDSIHCFCFSTFWSPFCANLQWHMMKLDKTSQQTYVWYVWLNQSFMTWYIYITCVDDFGRGPTDTWISYDSINHFSRKSQKQTINGG